MFIIRLIKKQNSTTEGENEGWSFFFFLQLMSLLKCGRHESDISSFPTPEWRIESCWKSSGESGPQPLNQNSVRGAINCGDYYRKFLQSLRTVWLQRLSRRGSQDFICRAGFHSIKCVRGDTQWTVTSADVPTSANIVHFFLKATQCA